MGCSQRLASCLRHSALIGPDLICHPSSLVRHPSPVICRQSSDIHRPSSVLCHLLSIIRRPMFVVLHLSSVIRCPSSTIRHPLHAACPCHLSSPLRRLRPAQAAEDLGALPRAVLEDLGTLHFQQRRHPSHLQRRYICRVRLPLTR